MNRTRRPPLALVTAASVVLLAAACDLAEPPHLIQVGHVDGFAGAAPPPLSPGAPVAGCAVAVEGGQLDVFVLDGSGPAPVERDPAATVLHALPGTKATVPSNPSFSFLGPAGADVWILPQVQDPDLLWLGWETMDIALGELQGNQLTWRLTAVDGPGAFSVFTTPAFGSPTVLFNSANGLPDSTVVASRTHVHANWGFTKPGRYTVTFEATATLANGTPVSSGPVPYTFTVDSYTCGDVDDLSLPASVAHGAPVNVAYTYTSCGADPINATVQAIVTAPAACGGATTTYTIDTHDLAAGASEAGSGSFTAPACPGTYAVKVKGNRPASSFAQQQNLNVT